MNAAVFRKAGDIRIERVNDPQLEFEHDAIIQVRSTAICGSDLHIYNGFFPQLKELVMGNEFMGVVVETGKQVKTIIKGDRVIVPFPIACRHCFFCEQGLSAHCENSNPKFYGPEGDMLKGKGGGLFGYTDLYGGYRGGHPASGYRMQTSALAKFLTRWQTSRHCS